MSFKLKGLIFLFLITCVLTACSDESNLESAENQPINKEEAFTLVHTFTKDTLLTGVKQAPLPEPYYIPLGAEYMANLRPIVYDEIPIKNNRKPLILIYARPYNDTLYQRIPSDTNYKSCIPPEEFDFTAKRIDVKKDNRIPLSPWMYKDEVKYDIQTLSTNQGLPTNNIKVFHKDVNGIMWIGTDKGLIAFDGIFIKHYHQKNGLPNNSITAINGDSKGNIYVGMESEGMCIYNGDYFSHLNLDSIRPNQPVREIAINENDDVWISLQFGGIINYLPNKIRLFGDRQGFFTARPLTGIAFGKNKEIWVSGYGQGLYCLRNDSVYQAQSPMSYANDVLVDKAGGIWLNGWNSDFSRIYNDSIYYYRLDRSYTDDYMSEIKEDMDGNIYVSSATHGVFRIKDGNSYNYSKSDGISWDVINGLLIDNQNNMWIATDGGGISRFNLKSFSNLNGSDGFETDFISDMDYADDKNFIYATDRGLFLENDSSFIHYTGFDNHNGSHFRLVQPVKEIVVQNNSIWSIGMNTGLLLIRDHKATIMGPGMSGALVNPTALAEDKNGELWMGSYYSEGLFRIKNDSMWKYYGNNGFAYKDVTDIVADEENNLWISSNGQGLAKVNENEIIYFSTNEGLKSNSINGLYFDHEERLWIASDNGLNYFENDSLHAVNSPIKFLNDFMHTVLVDEKERYWFAGEHGLVVLNPMNKTLDKNWNIHNYEMYILDKSGGLPNSEFIPQANFVDKDSMVYLGNKRGLLKWNPEDLFNQESAPLVYIDNIIVNDAIVSSAQNKLSGITFDTASNNSPFKIPENLVLASYNNNIVFNYSAIYWQAPRRLVFTYYLEGFENEWHVGGAEQKAEYTNLDYGNYSFHLKCEVPNTNKFNELEYHFQIERPWFHTWWARIFFFIGVVFIIYLIVRARTLQLKNRQLELENEVKNATTEIRQQKDEISTAHEEIKDSIAYAKRIQSAILPPRKLVKEFIPDSFILYIPKDIVAGDFYWMEQKNGKVLFAAADCTGHGVPGAMVSVICHNALNRSVREKGLTDPGKILDETRELIISEFEKSEDDVKDGMDIAICALNGNKLSYAGANNPLWIVRKDSSEIEEIKADKQPIGKFEFSKSFTTHEIILNPGDSFYIFSDGFADQFGGDKGKKFKGANFKRLILSMQNESMETQRELIRKTFESYKGSFEQVDDVCVIGVRF